MSLPNCAFCDCGHTHAKHLEGGMGRCWRCGEDGEACEVFHITKPATVKESLTVQPVPGRAVPLCTRCGRDCSKTDCVSPMERREEARGDGYDEPMGWGGRGKQQHDF